MQLDDEVARFVAWQFNEAVSLLREANRRIPMGLPLYREVNTALPRIQDALETLTTAAREAP